MTAVASNILNVKDKDGNPVVARTIPLDANGNLPVGVVGNIPTIIYDPTGTTPIDLTAPAGISGITTNYIGATTPSAVASGLQIITPASLYGSIYISEMDPATGKGATWQAVNNRTIPSQILSYNPVMLTGSVGLRYDGNIATPRFVRDTVIGTAKHINGGATADNNAILIRSGQTVLGRLTCKVSSGVTGCLFFKFWDKQTAPTYGTDSPALTYAANPGESVNIDFGGFFFTNGVYMTVHRGTGTGSISTTDAANGTDALTANDFYGFNITFGVT